MHDAASKATDAGIAQRAPRSSESAFLVAWIVVALSHAVLVVALVPEHRASGFGMVARMFFDAGQFLAVGLVFSAGFALTTRLCRKRVERFARIGLLATGVLSACVFSWLAADDLLGLAALLPGPATLYAHAFAAGLGLCLPIASEVASRLSCVPTARVAVAAVAFALVAANGFVLSTGYESLHLWLLALSASLIRGIFPADRDISGSALSRSQMLAHAVAALWASVALVAAPSASVQTALVGWPGSAAAPFVARAHAAFRSNAVGTSEADPKWLVPIERRKATPPTSPPLLTGTAPPRIVLLFTVDALRADVLADDKHAAILPTLTALRKEGVCFSDARATAPATGPSITSIMTGKYYSQIFWNQKKIGPKLKFIPLDDPSIGFPALLGEQGIATVHMATPGGPTLDTGLVRGFAKEILFKSSAREYPEALAKTLSEHKNERLFVYGHYIEPHAPYEGEGNTQFERYLSEVRAVDRSLGQILATVRSEGLESETVVIVSADHGEAFGEHGTTHHAATVYDELLRVPLCVRAPGLTNRTVATPISIIDLGPTILDLFGLPTPGQFMGTSLVPALRGGDLAISRPILADAGRRIQALVSDDGSKVIYDVRRGTLELFDLHRDPRELTNLADSQPDLAARKSAILRDIFRVHTLARPGYEPPYRP